MCGIVGIFRNSKQQVAHDVFEALLILQHRGQDSAGIATLDDQKGYIYKGKGLVSSVFNDAAVLQGLKGHMSVGHVRYRTTGDADNYHEFQPLELDHPFGIYLTHNGNLTNTKSIKQWIETDLMECLYTDSDSEILLKVFAYYLKEAILAHQADASDEKAMRAVVEAAVFQTQDRCEGAFSIVLMIKGVGLVAFRDRFGIRPLVLGKKDQDYMIASESVAFDVLGFTLDSDIESGEMVFISLAGNLHHAKNPNACLSHPCLFEYIYFARPDSVIEQVPVYQAREKIGSKLVDLIAQSIDLSDIDAVIPVPDTSRTAANVIAYQLGLPYQEGLIKNRYVGRTFIMPGQALRKSAIGRKLNPIKDVFRNKNVLLIDDSIVRGTTSQYIVEMARASGAKKIFLASCAPPIIYPNIYGIHMSSFEELIAHQLDTPAIAKVLGADILVYQTLENLCESIREINPKLQEFEDSVFTGKYRANF